MESYSKQLQFRWSDIDANNHLRHSAYYDFGAYLRVELLAEKGLTMQWMQENHVGPVLFREEALFKREIHMGDEVTINVEAIKATPDFSRWSLRHSFIKKDGTLAAILTVDGAWMDTVLRKLANPLPEMIRNAFESFPRAAEFEWIVKAEKLQTA